jgi:hypothetical protein
VNVSTDWSNLDQSTHRAVRRRAELGRVTDIDEVVTVERHHLGVGRCGKAALFVRGNQLITSRQYDHRRNTDCAHPRSGIETRNRTTRLRHMPWIVASPLRHHPAEVSA